MSRSPALAAAIALAVGVASCGGDDTSPLADNLTEPQQAALEQAWTQRIATLAAPADQVAAQATALYTTCAGLDRASAFLQSVRETCQPTAVTAKLRAVLDERCKVPSRQCVRALDRLAAANDTLVQSLQELGDAAKSVTEDPACRAQFTLSDVQLNAYTDLSTAYQAWALGVERQDADVRRLGRARSEDALRQASSSLTPEQQAERLRQACGLGEAA